MRKLLSLSFLSAALAAGAAQAADVAAVEAPLAAPVEVTSGGGFEISGYGGFQFSPHSDVDVSDQPDFTAGWDTNPFQMPPYWGIRGTYWFEGGALSNWGISLDYTHAKVYADDQTLADAGWSVFEFTDGLNLLTVNALYKFDLGDSPFKPYVGAGVGINVPHVEVTRPSGRTFDYQIGGATVQAQVGVRYEFNENWSVFTEYKGNYSWIDVDIDNGASLETNILTHAINFGVSYKF